LRGGEHQDLKIDNFVKRVDGGIDVKLFRSKTNQRGLNDRDGQAEMISLPNNKQIIDDYEFYFTKRPATAVNNFYLKPCTSNDIDFSKQWFYTRALPERTLKGYFRLICETTNIKI
ncbi:12628_t:CDS:2, partial [Cetraspora pellucida]